jgi:hypothetical protein
MEIKKYNDFIVESLFGDIIQRLASFNIPDLNYLLNQLISKDRESERKELCEEIIDVLKINKIDTSELIEEIEKLPYI